MRRLQGFWPRAILTGVVVASLALAGCSSDDGSNGAAGQPGASAYEIAVANGFTGTEAEWLASLQPPSAGGVATTADVESCAVCHTSVKAVHAATNVEMVSNVVSAIDVVTGDLVVTFNVKVDGVNNDGYTLRRAYKHFDNPALQTVPPTLITTFVRTQLSATAVPATVTFASNGAGNYTITVPAATVDNPAIATDTDATYLFQLDNAAIQEFAGVNSRPVVIVGNGTSPLRPLVSNDGCAKCHGPYPVWSEKFAHYKVGGNECQICHSQATRSTGFISENPDGTRTEVGPFPGTNIVEYVHGIHNSKKMPTGKYFRTSQGISVEDVYSIGYPSDMRNCAVCHTDPAQQEVISSQPVSYYLCMTCHQNWDGFKHVHDDPAGAFSIGDPIFAANNFHRSLGASTNCMSCHAAVPVLDEAYDFHNDFQATDAHYDSFYRGRDISFENPNNVGVQITGLTKSGDAVTFTWTASKDGALVNPCNTTLSNTAPTFRGLGAYLAYAKGDDWVNENVGNAPGQPAGARNLFTSLTTTCDATTNVATTTGLTIDPDANAYADKVVLAIGGKPLDQDSFLLGAAASNQAFFVREPSPTYEFSITDGTPVAPRRNAVSNDKCLGCHQGTLYQHGGDRVDNEQLCVVCHNPASGDKNNRLDRFQILNADGTVNTAATYDGKNNESYDMRTMIHAIHGVAKRETPWTIYRSRGIYAFAPAVYQQIPDPNDPTETITVEGAYPFPAGWPADGMTINGSTNGSTIAHNWTVVHYPRPINECTACHNEEAYEAVDQTKGVPLTVDPGNAQSGALTNNANYGSQADDIVIGPTAAACTACHATAPTLRHATSDFGYKANVTKDEMLQKAAQ